MACGSVSLARNAYADGVDGEADNTRRDSMAFTDQERAALLELRGVGPSVVQRFEEIGIDSFEALAEYEEQKSR